MSTSSTLGLTLTSSSSAQPELEPAPPAPRGLSSLSNTHILIATNVLIFLAMLLQSIWLSGSHRFFAARIGTDFDDKVLLFWGSNYGPLTLGGQYWRVLTCLFVHLNIFHLGGNMLLLWRLGKSLDRLLSRIQTLAIYLFTGIASSLASVAWHPTHLAFGFSGAIFGQAGALIALLALAKLNLPRLQTFGILFWIVLLTPFGLLSGHFSQTTDYAAHAGGLVSGLIIGVLLAWVLRGSPLRSAARQRWVLAVTIFTLVLSFGGVIAMRYNVVRQYRQRLELQAFLIAARKEESAKNIAAGKEALAKDPNDAAAHLKLANEYFLQSKYDEVANEYRLALEIKPGDPDTLSRLAMTYTIMGRASDAVPIFRKNLSQGPETTDKYTSFPWLLELTGSLNEAEEMARKAVALDNQSKRSHQQLASVLSQLHKTDEAERERKLADQLAESH